MSSLAKLMTVGFGLGVALACAEPAGDDSCTPGSALCECLNGACMVGLVCNNNFCVNPSSGETSGDGDGDTGDGDGDTSGDGDGDGDTSGDGDGDTSGDGDGDPGELPTDCAAVLAADPGAATGIYPIDLDGDGPAPMTDVLCDMDKGGGGWTLVFTSSDDGVDTWTWNNRAWLGDSPHTTGQVVEADLDYMSPAYHQLGVSDLLFIHQPSNVWAQYDAVGDGGATLGEIIQSTGSPVCDYALGGNGYAQTGGTLTASGMLCDTDLYFNLGDHEMDLNSCMDIGSGSNTSSFGPAWSADKGAGCPFDDPAEFGLGPHGPCGACPNNFSTTEFSYMGFANALNLNTGPADSGSNHMQIYVR